MQEKIEKNKKAPARAKAEVDYLLTTKLFCGHCGAYMCGESGKGRSGKVYHYYKCVSVKKKRTDCKKKAIKKDFIEEFVVRHTMKMLTDDKAIEAIIAMLMDLQERENVTLPLYEQQLRDVERNIENLLDAIQQGIFTKSTKARLDELEEAKEDLEIRIANEKLAKPKLTEEKIKHFLYKFRVLDMSKERNRRILIDMFINRIYLYDDKLVITFNHKDDAETITLEDIETALAEAGFGSDLVSFAVPNKRADTQGVSALLFRPPGGTRKDGPNEVRVKKCPVDTFLVRGRVHRAQDAIGRIVDCGLLFGKAVVLGKRKHILFGMFTQLQ